MVVRNAVGDHVDCIKLLVRISEPRQANGKVENFASINFSRARKEVYIRKVILENINASLCKK